MNAPAMAYPVAINSVQKVTVYVDLYNPLSTGVQANAALGWGYSGFPFGGCSGHLISSLAVYSGYFTDDNISGASPLPPYPYLGVSFCPLSGGPINVTFTFYPHSDVADVGSQLQSINEFITLSGYSSENYTLQPFPVGTYTVLVQDIWGHTALCYFYVTTEIAYLGG